MIKMQAIGHLGRDANVNNVNGKQVINFTVAHTEKYTSQGEKKEKTTWIECAYWVEKTGIAQYLKKGMLVYVEGLPDSKMYQTKDGRSVPTLNLRVLSIKMLSRVDNPQSTQGQASYVRQPEDDLPF